MKHFASIKDCSRFSAPCDLSETFFKKFKFFEKFRIFFPFCFFKKMFPVEKDGFFAVSSWGRMVFEIYAYPFGYFLALQNWWNFNNVILHLVLRMILLIWFSSKVRNLLRKCLRSTASPMCINFCPKKARPLSLVSWPLQLLQQYGFFPPRPQNWNRSNISNSCWIYLIFRHAWTLTNFSEDAYRALGRNLVIFH